MIEKEEFQRLQMYDESARDMYDPIARFVRIVASVITGGMICGIINLIW